MTEHADAPFPEGMVAEIEKFLAGDVNRPNGFSVYQDVFKTNLMFPLQRPAELAKMMSMAARMGPKVVMEIGADKGGGLYHWCKLPSVQTVIACEVRGLPYAHAFEEAFPRIRFLWLHGSSYDPDTARRVAEFMRDRGTTIDVLFIDGDKSAMRVDFDIYKQLMTRPGLAFVHDVQDPAPSEAFHGIMSDADKLREACETIIDTSDSQWAMQRKADKVESSCPHEDWLRHWAGRSCGVGVVHLMKE